MTTSFHVEIEVDALEWLSAIPDLAALAQAVAAQVGAGEGVVGEAALLFTGDAQMRALNAEFRGKDAPTNVLAFPAAEILAPGPRLWGDVALSFETAVREAQAQGKTLEAHAAHLIAHGLLHLLGHNHVNDAEAERMEARERDILAALGFSDPYAP